jgi:signal transduction histidine kinase
MRAPGPSEPRGRTTLPPLAGGAARARALLAPPRLPPAAAEAALRAAAGAAARVPVLLEVPAAGERLLVARALHAASGHAGPLVAMVGRRPSLDALPPGAALVVDAGRLAPSTALGLEALLDDGETWIVALVAPGARLRPALAARLAPGAVRIPPLAARRADVPALAAVLLAAFAARGSRPPPALTDAAAARLAAHDWPGDIAELQGVLGRAVAAGEDVVDVPHLGFDAPAPAAETVPAASGSELEFLLAELAHELRNPMVTIKTFADHLPALVDDAALRARFAALTAEAIERMDGLLDNLVAFARLGVPRPEPIEVRPLLERVVAEAAPELAGRTVRLAAAAAADARCAADPEHLAYALRNLFAGVAREVPAREEVLAEATANGAVTFRFAAPGAAMERLRRLAAPGDAPDAPTLTDPTLLPLPFRLARAVLERNGGGLTVVGGGGEPATLVVSLPTERDEARAGRS